MLERVRVFARSDKIYSTKKVVKKDVPYKKKRGKTIFLANVSYFKIALLYGRENKNVQY